MTITDVLPSVCCSTTSNSTADPSAAAAIAAMIPSNQTIGLNSDSRCRTRIAMPT